MEQMEQLLHFYAKIEKIVFKFFFVYDIISYSETVYTMNN
jgi:hypothetical protein